MNRESGNALFLILIAVALFAALSYAVTQSGRGGSGVDREAMQIEVAELENYIAAMRNGIQRLRIIGRWEPYEIDYSDSVSSNSGPNGHCSIDDSCKLFKPNGGGVAGRALEERLFTEDQGASCNLTGWTGKWNFVNISIKGIGDDNMRDLTARTVVSKPLCLEINRKYEVDNPSGNPPYDSWNWSYNYYSGHLSQEVPLASPPVIGEDNVPSIAGKTMFCTMTGWGCYFLHAVLIER